MSFGSIGSINVATAVRTTIYFNVIDSFLSEASSELYQGFQREERLHIYHQEILEVTIVLWPVTCAENFCDWQLCEMWGRGSLKPATSRLGERSLLENQLDALEGNP